MKDWHYSIADSCKQTKICSRCGTQESRVAHGFEEWHYRENSSCEQNRVCQKCGIQERQIAHDFEEWQYREDSSCEQMRVCKRDRCIEKRINHQWETITEEGGGMSYRKGMPIEHRSITTIRRCQRCNQSTIIDTREEEY
jgi:hypothetical protein